MCRDMEKGAVNVISVVAGVAAVAPARGSPCRSRSRWTRCVVLLVLGFALATPTPSRADIGVIVLEPIGALGFFTRVGHAGTYFSNICQDGSPIRMRLCLPGEGGGVVSKYSPLSEHEDYDWATVPFEEYMHGLASPDFAPMIGTPKLQGAIERYNFGPLFSSDLKTKSARERPASPAGQLRSADATEPSQGLSSSVPNRCTFRNDGDTRCAFTEVVSKPSHLALERVDAFADAANGSLQLIGAHSTERPYSWEGADFVTMPSMTSEVPPHTEATSAVTEESNGRAHPRAAPFGTRQPLPSPRPSRRVDRPLLSQDASPTEQPHEEKHDRDHQ